MKLIMLGAPGAGKGTQAQILSERLDIPTISTGALLREAVKADTPLGREVKSTLDAGGLVPDGLVVTLVKERLARPDCQAGFILDGFPRTLPQALALEDMGVEIDYVLNIHVDDQAIMERMGGRRVCEDCGATYHLESQPSSAGELCERCGASLTLRPDDRPETVANRLKTYHEQTAPLVEYYRNKGKLKVVVGQKAIEGTTEMTFRALGEQP